MKQYEAISNFNFRDVSNGNLIFINPGDKFEIKAFDSREDKIRIVSEDNIIDCYVSLLAFATHFMEAKND